MKSSQDEKKSTHSEWSNEPLKRNDLVTLLEKTKKLTEMYQEVMKDKREAWEGMLQAKILEEEEKKKEEDIEIAKGLFHKEKLNLGLLKSISGRNTPTVDLNVEEDDIVIFPSKTKHATIPNLNENPRISISGDVTIMLTNSYGHERLMPHFNNWQ